jgi:predicted ATPase
MGSGKTRLALEAASKNRSAWKDGVYFTVLKRHFSSASDLKEALVKSMGIQSGNSIDHRKNLSRFIHNKEMLIVLDDIDELPDESDLIQTLLVQHPNIKFLVTSRRHLGIRGEKVVEVGGLDYPSKDELKSIDKNLALEKWVDNYSAMQFFFDVAKSAKNDFESNWTNIEHIITCCEMLIGLPLGLEIAASYSRLFTPQEIADGIFGALHSDNQQHTFISQRHSHFRKTFETMWNTLTQTERDLLTLIYPFPDGVVTDDLLARNEATIETLVTLQDKSTLIRLPGSRVKLHPLVRLYVNSV